MKKTRVIEILNYLLGQNIEDKSKVLTDAGRNYVEGKIWAYQRALELIQDIDSLD